MNVLVTGANGFVGNNLVRALLAKGQKVRAMVHHNRDSLANLEVEIFEGDILSPMKLDEAMKDIDIVYHLAACIDIEGSQREKLLHINVKGPANVVEACLRTGIKKLIHFSSIHALSYKPKDQAVDENRELALTEDHLGYDHSKALGEQEILKGVQKGLHAVILNPVGVIGPYDFGPSPLGESLLQIHHRQLPGLVKGGFYWVDVRDVVEAALQAAQKGRSGERYILHSEYTLISQFATWVQETTGSKPPFFTSPLWLAAIVAPFMTFFSKLIGKRPLFTSESIQILRCHQQIKTRKAQIELGFSPRPIEESVKDAIRWFAANGRFTSGGLLESNHHE